MVSGLLSRLRGKVGRESKESIGTVNLEELIGLCEFEKNALKRGLSIDDLAYYALPFHEDEASHVLNKDSMSRLRRWYEVTQELGVASICEVVEKEKT